MMRSKLLRSGQLPPNNRLIPSNATVVWINSKEERSENQRAMEIEVSETKNQVLRKSSSIVLPLMFEEYSQIN